MKVRKRWGLFIQPAVPDQAKEEQGGDDAEEAQEGVHPDVLGVVDGQGAREVEKSARQPRPAVVEGFARTVNGPGGQEVEEAGEAGRCPFADAEDLQPEPQEQGIEGRIAVVRSQEVQLLRPVAHGDLEARRFVDPDGFPGAVKGEEGRGEEGQGGQGP